MNPNFYIKTSLLFFFITLLFFAHAQNHFSIQDLHWFAGSWVGEDSVFIENWQFSNGLEMVGKVSPYQSHDAEVLENLQIIEENEEIVYRALPFENTGWTEFILTSTTAQEWVFKNPDHNFPQKISYNKIGVNQINITLTGDGEKMEFKYFKFEPWK